MPSFAIAVDRPPWRAPDVHLCRTAHPGTLRGAAPSFRFTDVKWAFPMCLSLSFSLFSDCRSVCMSCLLFILVFEFVVSSLLAVLFFVVFFSSLSVFL